MSLIIAAAALSGAMHGAAAPAAGAAPKVVRTSPKEGETIAPGPLVLSVTYDRPMLPGSMSFAGVPADFPKECGTPQQSKDGRTYTMRCVADAGRHYEVWFNREPYMNFKSAEGVSAEPYRLTFSVAPK